MNMNRSYDGVHLVTMCTVCTVHCAGLYRLYSTHRSVLRPGPQLVSTRGPAHTAHAVIQYYYYTHNNSYEISGDKVISGQCDSHEEL